MKHRHATITAILFATLVMAFAPYAPAEANWAGVDNTTHMTFKHPVRIPGVTLPGGQVRVPAQRQQAGRLDLQ